MKYKVTLNDKVYEVEVEAGKAVLLDEYEACAPAPAAKVDLKAGEPVNSPMPGNILRVEVKEGEQIKAGQLMENEILAPHDGTVAQVVVSKGTTVETGSPLIVLA